MPTEGFAGIGETLEAQRRMEELARERDLRARCLHEAVTSFGENAARVEASIMDRAQEFWEWVRGEE